MSDLSIPGVTDKYNTQKIIDALMTAKREPLTRMQKGLDLEQQRKTAWQDITPSSAGSVIPPDSSSASRIPSTTG